MGKGWFCTKPYQKTTNELAKNQTKYLFVFKGYKVKLVTFFIQFKYYNIHY